MTNRTISDRFYEHMLIKKTSSRHLYHSLRKYHDVLVTELHVGTMEECLEVEEKYRPSDQIGWNMTKGGGVPPKVTKETALKISKTLKTLRIRPSDEAIALAHTPESCQKAKISKRGYKWYYDPLSGERITCHPDHSPIGWLPGKQYNVVIPKKPRGSYECHVATWSVTDPDGNTHRVRNLKAWCRINDHDYMEVYASRSGWSTTKLPLTCNDS